MPNFDKLMGWGGIRLADKAWDKVGSTLPKFFIAGQSVSTEGKTFRAWDVWRKALKGADLEREIQETGDCVGSSMTTVIDGTQLIEIYTGDREKFEPVLTSYHYATSRVLIGENQLRGGAGSVGSWMAKAVQKYGVLKKKFKGCPAYSGKLSDKWGDGKDYNGIKFDDFIDEGDDHLIRACSRITDWSQLRDAIINGHLCTIASNRGYNMNPTGGARGFHRPSGTWAHQMSIVALSDDPKSSWVGIGNQWGDVHGRLIDLQNDEPWPPGMLRVERSDFERRHLTSSAECFVFSRFDGYPDQSDDLDGLLI